MDFEKRCKEVDAKFTEKIADMRKQLDNRWRQIDKFETSLKTVAETKTTWKRKFAQKEGELEAIKVSSLFQRFISYGTERTKITQTSNIEMANQLAGMKKPGGSDAMELRSMTARAVNAERRLNNAQNQLLTREEAITAMNQKNAAADNKWEARVKEYEARLKAAEERVKRERQGSKERIAELENITKCVVNLFLLAHHVNIPLTLRIGVCNAS
jgi:predicted  nucleic acid-binding Zn-ribbon protein